MYRALVVVLLVLALGVVAWRSSVTAEKVGFVELNRALLAIAEGKDAKARLLASKSALQKSLDDEEAGVKREQTALDLRASGMTREDWQAATSKVQVEQRAVTSHWEAKERDLKDQETALTNAIYAKMKIVTADIAAREGYTHVVDTMSVIYGSSAHDLTDELVKEYDERHPVH